MDKIEKFLKKLSPREQSEAEGYIANILRGNTSDLNVKRLRGYADVFRFRKGNLRIIYQQQGRAARLISVGRRNDNIYRDF